MVKEIAPEWDTAVRSISIAPDGLTAVAANHKGNCFAWDLQKGEGGATQFRPTHRLHAHDAYILKCLVSPDGHYLATTSADNTVRLWKTAELELGQPWKTLIGHQRWVWDCVFSADSAYLVTTSSDATVRLWDLAQAETIRHYTGHAKAVTAVALHDLNS